MQVPVYRCQRGTGPHAGAVYFQVVDRSQGRRRRLTFSDPDRALAHASRLATEIARGEAAGESLRMADRAAYARAIELLAPTGVSLEVAAATFAEAHRLLGGDRILDAIREHLRRHPASLTIRTVPEVVEELLATKGIGQLSPRYLTDLRIRLNRFAVDHPGRIAELGTPDLQKWLDERGGSPVTQRNYRQVLHLLFEFAITRGYRPEETNPVSRTATPRNRDTDVTIYQPEEMSRLLAEADGALRTMLALGAFAGIRQAELNRLDWEDISLEQRRIQIPAGKAKAASRRVIPLSDNLAEWLVLHPKRHGPIWPEPAERYYPAVRRILARVNEAHPSAPLHWRPNALRHSYGSYRLALTQNVPQVAVEMGNSPDMVHRHYKQLVTTAQAMAWFDLRPDGAEVIAPAFRS